VDKLSGLSGQVRLQAHILHTELLLELIGYTICNMLYLKFMPSMHSDYITFIFVIVMGDNDTATWHMLQWVILNFVSLHYWPRKFFFYVANFYFIFLEVLFVLFPVCVLDDILQNNCNAPNYAVVVSIFSYGFLEKQTLCICDLSNSKLLNHLLRAIEVEPVP